MFVGVKRSSGAKRKICVSLHKEYNDADDDDNDDEMLALGLKDYAQEAKSVDMIDGTLIPCVSWDFKKYQRLQDTCSC